MLLCFLFCLLGIYSQRFTHLHPYVPFACKLSLLALCSNGVLKAVCTVPTGISHLVLDIRPVLTKAPSTFEELVND